MPQSPVNRTVCLHKRELLEVMRREEILFHEFPLIDLECLAEDFLAWSQYEKSSPGKGLHAPPFQ